MELLYYMIPLITQLNTAPAQNNPKQSVNDFTNLFT